MQFFESFLKLFTKTKKPYFNKGVYDWAQTEYKQDSEWALDNYRKSGKFPKGTRHENEINERKMRK